MLYTLRFFSLQNAVCFTMLTCLVPVLFTFYVQEVLKLIKNNSGTKGLSALFSCLTKPYQAQNVRNKLHLGNLLHNFK